MSEDHLQRLARLEERMNTYDINWIDNKTDHKSLMLSVNRIETNIMVYKYVVWTAALLIGSAAGFIVREWDWLTRHLGHS